jgi:SAM-dependent methyltransferase
LEQQAYREQFELEDSHWWFQGRRSVIWALLRRAGTTGDLRVLDAGCGTGRNVIEFGGLGDVKGIDFSPDAIEFCRRRGLADVQQGAIEQLPFGDQTFDLILATDVIEHLRDDGAALAEMRRVAAPGGRLLVTVPAYRWLWSEHDESHHHFRRYTLRRLSQELRSQAWEPLVATYFNALLLPPIAGVRMLGRLRGADGGGRNDLTMTPPALNRVLGAPMRIEAGLIAHGARLPAGVSIGVVAERR